MFCPQCGTETHEQLKYCKQCGTNLRRVQGVMGKGGAGFNASNEGMFWHQDWLAERREERELQKRKSPEEKRLEEIKAGVITSCVGIGVFTFLFFLFDALSNIVAPAAREILRSVPFAGLIPILVGLGLIFNGLFISKRIVELRRQREASNKQPLFSSAPDTAPVQRLPEASQTPVSDFSITESTTTKLHDHVPIAEPRDTN